MHKRIWITWEKQRRNRTLSKALGARLFEFDLKCNRFLRYPLVMYKTFGSFISEKPDLIFVQNPSLVLSFFAVTYGLLFNIPVIVDAHNAGVYPFNGKYRWADLLATYLFRRAPITIVSNNALAEYVKKKGGNPVALPDPIPEFNPPLKKKVLKGTFNVLFICSWAEDEPYSEVIQAARLLDRSIYIYITGNSKGKEKEHGNALPENVVLTGYLAENEYIETLYACDAAMDLTTRSDCLVCGAYESIAAEKPLIVSNSGVLMEYFSRGVLYTTNTSSDLAAQMTMAVMKKDELGQHIKELKRDKINEWTDRMTEIETLLANIKTVKGGQ